jgi:ElaB/YqjD/DUF883 family membrane-anchored ribosome-binding protein
VVLLVWVYYAAQIVLFGAELTLAYAAESGSRQARSVDAATPQSGYLNKIEAAAFSARRFSSGAVPMAQSSPYGGRSDLSDRAEDLKDKATDQFKKVADRVEGVAGAAADQMREVGDRAGEVAGNFKTAVDKSVKTQPMATLAMAAALGFVLGALWKS